MRWWTILAAALLGVGAVTAYAMPGDPFDDARYYIQIKESAKALELIDSGQFDINMQNDEGYTLLHFAAAAGDLAFVKAMLARGADPTIKTYKPELVPYQMAYSTLIKAELRKAMSAAAAPGTGAARPGAAAPAADAKPSGSNGMCAMARAEPASSSRSPAMRPFLKAKDAVWYNHPDELIGLLDDCVKVDQQDEWGWTLLHQAAQRDRVALAKILLDRGANRTLRNKDGQTAAQLATSPEMKALLGPATPPSSAVKPADQGRGVECQQKYRADVALCSDSTCKMRGYRKWQQCLKTGSYW